MTPEAVRRMAIESEHEELERVTRLRTQIGSRGR
jgi:hypothetical protein